MRMTSSSPGMGAAHQRPPAQRPRARRPVRLATVGRVNDLAYGNPDGRLERTLAPLPDGLLLAYKRRPHGRPASSRSRCTTARTAGSRSWPPPRTPAARAWPGDVMARVALDAQGGRPHHDVAPGHRARARSSTARSATAGCPTCSCGSAGADAQPGTPGRPLLPALRRRGETSTTRARSSCPNCGYAAFFNPKPVACAIPRDAHGNIILMRRATEPGYGPLDDARRLRRPRRVGAGGGRARGARRRWRSTSRSGSSSASTAAPPTAWWSSSTRRRTTQTPQTTEEALEVRAFSRSEIPWADLAFWSDERALREHLG